MAKVEDVEQVALVGARMFQALNEECDSAAATYLSIVIPGLHESWRGFCANIIANKVSDGDELAEMVSDGEFWPAIPAVTKESAYVRDVFAYALNQFEEWDEWARYLDRDDGEDDDE